MFHRNLLLPLCLPKEPEPVETVLGTKSRATAVSDSSSEGSDTDVSMLDIVLQDDPWPVPEPRVVVRAEKPPDVQVVEGQDEEEPIIQGVDRMVYAGESSIQGMCHQCGL